jgi:hypothetical protein
MACRSSYLLQNSNRNFAVLKSLIPEKIKIAFFIYLSLRRTGQDCCVVSVVTGNTGFFPIHGKSLRRYLNFTVCTFSVLRGV